jgi:hypothetical protein
MLPKIWVALLSLPKLWARLARANSQKRQKGGYAHAKTLAEPSKQNPNVGHFQTICRFVHKPNKT